MKVEVVAVADVTDVVTGVGVDSGATEVVTLEVAVAEGSAETGETSAVELPMS